MSEATLHWLDTALVDGRLLDGHAVVSGDLDDWPFRAGERGQAAKGLFEANGRLDGAVVKFQPDWPAADHLDGDVSFVGNGFTVDGRGAIAGVAIPRLEAGIADFSEANLEVDADAKTDAAKLLALLQDSPLREARAETLDNLTASGPITASFMLDLPLHHGAPAPRIGGRIALAGASLGEKRWKLAFDDVHGEAAYDHEGFTAENLRAVHQGQPGRLALRAGKGHVRDRGNAFEAEVAATLDAHELLDYAPEMARSEEHTSELQSLMRNPYALFCLKKKKKKKISQPHGHHYENNVLVNLTIIATDHTLIYNCTTNYRMLIKYTNLLI